MTSPLRKTLDISPQKLISIKKKNRRYLLFFNFIQGFLISIINTLAQPYLYSIVQSEATVGLISTLSQFFMFIPQFWTGKLSDKWGRKLLISIGNGFIILGIFSVGYLNKVLWIEIGLLLFYFGTGVSDPAYNNFINENKPPGKSASNFGVMYFLYFGGSVFANSLIDFLGESYGYQFYFRLFAFVALGQIILMILLMHEKTLKQERTNQIAKIHQNEEINEDHHLKKSTWKLIVENPDIRNLTIYLTFDGFIWGIALSTYYAGLLANFPMTKENIAQMALVFNIVNMILQIPAGRLTDRIGPGRALILSVASGIFFFGLIIVAWFTMSSNFFLWLILGQAWFAISVVLYIPTSYSMATGFSKHRNAEIYGTIMAIKGIGFIPTGIIGGYLMEKVHFLVPIIFVLCCLPLEILFLYRSFVHKPIVQK